MAERVAFDLPIPNALPEPASPEEDLDPDFQYVAEQFADLRVLRYQVPGFNELPLQQKKLLYYLSEAALSGRDIIWDQNFKHNLRIRRVLEGILATYPGPRKTDDWRAFEVYAKRVFFSNGIHHHYSSAKIPTGFSQQYFEYLLGQCAGMKWPLTGSETKPQFIKLLTAILFDPKVAPKKVNLAAGQDLLRTSAMNFYENVTQAEAEAYYATKIDTSDHRPVSWGLNSKLEKGPDGKLTEQPWREDGMYGDAIRPVIFWLERAVTEAENARQKDALIKLIQFYRTGDLRAWDDYSVAWVKDVDSRTDVVSGFIEVYGDPLGYRASYESVVSFKDLAATRVIKAIGDEAQWFEDNSPILPEHKKKTVTGITAKVITVVQEAGDAAPATPIGINLPNATWIREQHGSKSVSLGNIVYAGNEAGKSGGVLEEFAFDAAEIARAKQYGTLAAALHTDMHEVIGHASGQINPGVGTPKETLKSYASAVEEARADLVGLYYVLDPKLVDLGVMPDLEVGRAQYDAYIRNALVVQLARLAPGEHLEEAHMRNRQLVASWAYEQGRADSVIMRGERAGKTYYHINDYDKLRALFGRLLRETQRLTSEGDYAAAQHLIETYGVKVDARLHDQVLRRYAKLKIAPYQGFIQPRLVPVLKGAAIIDVQLEYPTNFMGQMLDYGKRYSFLPNLN
ncbi:MAG: dihydrofolate reductase [Hymenobacteraceae bacterium]|nr:dihydrofolate reductase [Hymenobacteraceae bacterium]